MSAHVVLGLDIGGTWTRALVVGVPGGIRLGASRRAGANPTTHGVDAAAMHIEAAITEALAEAGLAAPAVDACVIGMAGASKLVGDPAAAEAIATLWRRIGLRCTVEIVADVTTAFAAGSPEPNGSVLLAGTGAIAATMRDRRPAGILGGHGWLLGDEGSGFWIGRQAVRATLRDLDDGVTPSGLVAAVLAELVPSSAMSAAGPAATTTSDTAAGPTARTASTTATPAMTSAPAAPTAAVAPAAPTMSGTSAAAVTPTVPTTSGTSAAAGAPTISTPTISAVDAAPDRPDFGLGEGRRLAAAVIAAANARRPVHLATLVPLVLTAAAQGDRNASRILHEAADLLVATLTHARDAGGTRNTHGAQDPAAPIVLAGGILAPGSPVHRLVLTAVAETWPMATITTGMDGAAGAAWLAALRLLGDGLDAAALHSRLFQERFEVRR